MSDKKRIEYQLQFAKERYKRVPLDLTKEKYQEAKDAAARAGMPLNTFIKAAIDEKIEREKD